MCKPKVLRIKDPDKAWESIDTFVNKQVSKLEGQYKQNDTFIILFDSSQSKDITIESEDKYNS